MGGGGAQPQFQARASYSPAQWAREAEHVLPFTGGVLMRGICRAIYLPQDRKEPLLEREGVDIACDLQVLPPERIACALRVPAVHSPFFPLHPYSGLFMIVVAIFCVRVVVC